MKSVEIPGILKGKFPAPVDRAVVARDWDARGYGCDLFVDPPGRQWNGFVHRTNEVVTVVEGRLRLRIGGQQFEAEPGDEVFIPAGVEHDVHNIYSDTSYWLYGYD